MDFLYGQNKGKSNERKKLITKSCGTTRYGDELEKVKKEFVGRRQNSSNVIDYWSCFSLIVNRSYLKNPL